MTPWWSKYFLGVFCVLLPRAHKGHLLTDIDVGGIYDVDETMDPIYPISYHYQCHSGYN